MMDGGQGLGKGENGERIVKRHIFFNQMNKIWESNA